MSANMSAVSDTSRSSPAADVAHGARVAAQPRVNDVKVDRPSNPLDSTVMESREARMQTVIEKSADQQKEQSRESVAGMTEKLNTVMDTFHKGLRFEVNTDINELYVEVVNKDTNEVIKTIPSEEAMEMMERMRNVLGMILDIEG